MTGYQGNMALFAQALRACTANSKVKQRQLKQLVDRHFKTLENNKVVPATELLASGFDREALIQKYQEIILDEFKDALAQFLCFEYFDDEKTKEFHIRASISIVDLSKGITNLSLIAKDDKKDETSTDTTTDKLVDS